MILSYQQFIWSIFYAAVQLIATVLLATNYNDNRVKRTINSFFVTPYRNGIVLGDVISALTFLPAIILVILTFGTLPFIGDTFVFLFELKLTKPRPRKQ
jgi:hypothetical protein